MAKLPKRKRTRVAVSAHNDNSPGRRTKTGGAVLKATLPYSRFGAALQPPFGVANPVGQDGVRRRPANKGK